jgi:hypothetical protein
MQIRSLSGALDAIQLHTGINKLYTVKPVYTEGCLGSTFVFRIDKDKFSVYSYTGYINNDFLLWDFIYTVKPV